MKRDPAETGLLTAAIRPRLETPEEEKTRRHREWLKSLEIGSDIPPLTPADMVRGKPRFRTITQILKDSATEAAKRRRERELAEYDLAPIPEAEFD